MVYLLKMSIYALQAVCKKEVRSEMLYQIIIFYIPMLLLFIFVGYMIYKRSQYKNKANAGAFFFEDNSLVLNTGLPYAIPFDQIDRVELHYNSWELEHQLSYSLSVKVFQKNGKSKLVFYKGYRTAKLALPSDMEAALKEKGLHCVMVDSNKKC